MKETRYAKTLLLLLAGTFVFSSVIWYWWSDSLSKAYPSYLKSEKLDGIVVDVIKDTRSAARVTFVDGKKLSLPWANNFHYNEPNLPKWIMEGDRIVKKEDCDTIIVIRDGVKFLFVANTSIEIEENSAISAVRSFYKINHAIWSSPPPDPLDYDKKLDSIAEKYCTPRLRWEIKSWLDDGRHLITDDYNTSMETFGIASDWTNENTFIVSFMVEAPPIVSGKPTTKKIELRVGVIEEGGRFKLDSVTPITD